MWPSGLRGGWRSWGWGGGVGGSGVAEKRREVKEHSICSKSDQAARLHLMHLQLILYMLMAATHTHLHEHDEAHSFHDTQNDSFQSTHIFFLIYIYFRQRHSAAIQHPLCYHFLFSSGGSQRDKICQKVRQTQRFYGAFAAESSSVRPVCWSVV